MRPRRWLVWLLAVALLAGPCGLHIAGGGLSFGAWRASLGAGLGALRVRLVSDGRAAQPAASHPAPALLATYPELGSGEALQDLRPAVHGRQRKAGVAERLHWSLEPKYSVAREAIFNSWREQERQRPAPPLQPGEPPTCAAARHPPAPYHHCHVFVNHKYKIAYVRSPKSSSTSIINWLGQCHYNKTRNWNATTCMEYSWERYRSIDEVRELWSDYFIFGFIRNPWNRAYSLYKDLVGTNHFIHKHGPRCSVEWGRFCTDPFGEFDRLHAGGCGHVEPHYAYWHMMDQYHCMVTSTGEWAVDFLGRVESGDEDWEVVVDEMNRRRLLGVPEVQYSSYGHVHAVEPGQKPPQRPARPRPAPARRSLRSAVAPPPGGGCGEEGESGPYCGATAHCADAVAQWYGCDVEMFGFLPQRLQPPPRAELRAETAAQAAAGADTGAAAAVVAARVVDVAEPAAVAAAATAAAAQQRR